MTIYHVLSKVGHFWEWKKDCKYKPICLGQKVVYDHFTFWVIRDINIISGYIWVLAIFFLHPQKLVFQARNDKYLALMIILPFPGFIAYVFHQSYSFTLIFSKDWTCYFCAPKICYDIVFFWAKVERDRGSFFGNKRRMRQSMSEVVQVSQPQLTIQVITL